MCGLFGVIGPNPAIQIDSVLKSIKHRGPDDSGEYKANSIQLGFCRLSIIDLSPRGHQPMSNEDGTVWLIFNGEIYNFRDIKKELQDKHKFKSETDTEVIIHGYEEWGIDGILKRLNGMFAFCLYDQTKNMTFLVRDRIGKKPLYYYESNNYLAFSSEVKAFFDLPDFSFDIDPKTFDLFMGFSYLPDNSTTLLKNVYKISPGYYMKIYPTGEKKTVCYWNLSKHPKSVEMTGNVKDKMENLLIDSVNKRLIADVPVGVLLSGGLDSSLVTAIASKFSKRQIRTLTISFGGSCIDEREYARLVAKHCDTQHTELDLVVEDIYSEFKKNIWIYDDLSTVDGGLFSEFLLAKKVRETGVKVVLVGEGADEIFGGYTWFQLAQYPFAFLPPFIRTFGYYYAFMRSLPGVRFAKYSTFLNKKLGEFSEDYFKKIQGYEIKYSLPNHYCMKVDKGASAASIEARSPYMDYRVTELAYNLNKEAFLKDSLYRPKKPYEKYILREIAKKYLPSRIYTRKKKGGMLPTYDLLNEGVVKDRELILNNPLLTDFFGTAYLEELILQKPQLAPLKWQREWVLWKCLIFSLWYEYCTILSKK